MGPNKAHTLQLILSSFFKNSVNHPPLLSFSCIYVLRKLGCHTELPGVSFGEYRHALLSHVFPVNCLLQRFDQI